MSLVSYLELCELVESGVIDAPISQVNGSSIDVTLHHVARIEKIGSAMKKVRIADGESIETTEIDITDGHLLMPDAVILGSTVETLNMPLWLSATFALKSTLGRNYIGHQLAGHIDPGFVGMLTLELKNDSQFSKLILSPGMKIGQILFHKHEQVPIEHSYASRGQYQGQNKVTGAGLLR